MNDLASFKKNITSQWGEDGILGEILRRLAIKKGLCVDCGAWDGEHLSNVWSLWHDKGWRAVLIEGDAARFGVLKEKTAAFPLVTAYHAYVTDGPSSSVDAILTEACPDTALDVLSIDIDGDDYYIFKSIQKFLPKILIIEHNPTIPPPYSVIQKPGEYFGASASALVALAETKGYALAAMTDTNCLFVRTDQFPKLSVDPVRVEEAFVSNHLSYLISSYDGAYMFANRYPPFVPNKPMSGRRPSDPFTSETPFIPVRLNEDITAFSRAKRALLRGLRRTFRGTVVHRIHKALQDQKIAQRNLRRHEEKQDTVRTYQKKFGIDTLIETGTYRGDMVAAMKNTFQKIISIELGEDLYAKARERFRNDPHVEILQGDSAVALAQVLHDHDAAALFWLDAHYSRGETARGAIDSPITEELRLILEHSHKRHVILIDDARCFVGEDGYPTISAIEKHLCNDYPHYECVVANDIIRITPRACT